MYRNKTTLAFTGLLFFSFLSWNCTKIDTTTIGSSLIPVVDNVNTFETFIDVAANTIDTSGDCTTVSQLQDQALGIINNDPLFGKSSATIYTELEPLAFPFNFQGKPIDRKLDSVVLVLSYKATFGDSSVSQKVTIFEINTTGTKFKPDTSSCTFYPYINFTSLGSKIFKPVNLKDTVKAFQDTTINQLRIKLSTAFAQRLLNLDSTVLKSDSLFKNFFKGFAIVPDAAFGGNAFTYYNLVDPNTKLAIYYKYPNVAGRDTATVDYFKLAFTSSSANYITRDSSTGEVNQHRTFLPAGDNVIYIQTTPGISADLRFPSLGALSNRIVHRAELIIDQVYSPAATDTFFASPPVLFIDIKNALTGNTFKPIPCDFNTFSGIPNIGTFGGFRTIVKDPFGNKISRYSFNISRYIQKVVSKVLPNVPFRLRAPDYFYNPTGYLDECGQGVAPLFNLLNTIAYGRVKLGGGSNANYKMKLRIVYSNL